VRRAQVSVGEVFQLHARSLEETARVLETRFARQYDARDAKARERVYARLVVRVHHYRGVQRERQSTLRDDRRNRHILDYQRVGSNIPRKELQVGGRRREVIVAHQLVHGYVELEPARPYELSRGDQLGVGKV